jgi:hypothetical protein
MFKRSNVILVLSLVLVSYRVIDTNTPAKAFYDVHGYYFGT